MLDEYDVRRLLKRYTRLRELYNQKQSKFSEISALLARQIGYGELTNMSSQQRERLENETQSCVDHWEETVELDHPFKDPTTPLQCLLREHHDICELILDEQDAIDMEQFPEAFEDVEEVAAK